LRMKHNPERIRRRLYPLAFNSFEDETWGFTWRGLMIKGSFNSFEDETAWWWWVWKTRKLGLSIPLRMKHTPIIMNNTRAKRKLSIPLRMKPKIVLADVQNATPYFQFLWGWNNVCDLQSDEETISHAFNSFEDETWGLRLSRLRYLPTSFQFLWGWNSF